MFSPKNSGRVTIKGEDRQKGLSRRLKKIQLAKNTKIHWKGFKAQGLELLNLLDFKGLIFNYLNFYRNEKFANYFGFFGFYYRM